MVLCGTSSASCWASAGTVADHVRTVPPSSVSRTESWREILITSSITFGGKTWLNHADKTEPLFRFVDDHERMTGAGLTEIASEGL